MTENNTPVVGVIMGSQSDWPTLEKAAQTLSDFGVNWESKVVSAHRTPDLLYEYANSAKSRGLKCIIAGAGGAAHLPGMAAAMTPLPVLGYPSNHGPSMVWTLFFPSYKCQLVFPRPLLRLVMQEPSMPPFLPYPCSPPQEMRNLAQKLDDFRQAQSDKVKASELSPPTQG